MMKNNNTMEWLGGKNEEDKIQIMAKFKKDKISSIKNQIMYRKDVQYAIIN